MSSQTKAPASESEEEDEFPQRPDDQNVQLLVHAVKVGKRAFWTGFGTTLVAFAFAIGGLILSNKVTGSMHRTWFILAVVTLVVVLGVQTVLMWELSDGLNRHPEPLVRRLRIVYEVVTIGAFSILFLLTAIWTFKGSFIAREGNSTPATVVIVLEMSLFFLGEGASLFLYHKYATMIHKTKVTTARLTPATELQKTVSQRARGVARKTGGSLRRIARSASRTSSRRRGSTAIAIEVNGPDDQLPQDTPVYDHEASVRAGHIVSRPSSPAYSRSSFDSKSSIGSNGSSVTSSIRRKPLPVATSRVPSSDEDSGADESEKSLLRDDPASASRRRRSSGSVSSNDARHPLKRDDELFLPDLQPADHRRDDRLSLPSQNNIAVPRRAKPPVDRKVYRAYQPPSSSNVTSTSPPLEGPTLSRLSSSAGLPNSTRQSRRASENTANTTQVRTSRRQEVPHDDEAYFSDSEREDDDEIDARLSRKYSGALSTSGRGGGGGRRLSVTNPSPPRA